MAFRLTFKRLRISVLLLILFALLSVPLADLWIRVDSRKAVYHTTDHIPAGRVGLVLGCGPNVYFHYRINAAVELFNAGKIDFILVSGDNGTVYYDETSAMKKALLQRGIPENRIVCDYAGFSTIDSVIRAKEIFGLSTVTVISQEFHVRRAIFIARRKGIEAIGFCARDVEKSRAAPTLMREQFARVKTILDLYFLRRRPRFLGEPIRIGDDAAPALAQDKA
ncbi:vancomycin high temperature exclusion protein [Pontiella sp.]|uniref:SanA/YdcF family protein n=1 Tax=Pontiella sp. TaxID=2837462 RepID=UPI0035677E04